MEEKETIQKVASAASIGATAGIGIAVLFGAPILVPALIGGGLACLGGAILASKKD